MDRSLDVDGREIPEGRDVLAAIEAVDALFFPGLRIVDRTDGRGVVEGDREVPKARGAGSDRRASRWRRPLA